MDVPRVDCKVLCLVFVLVLLAVYLDLCIEVSTGASSVFTFLPWASALHAASESGAVVPPPLPRPRSSSFRANAPSNRVTPVDKRRYLLLNESKLLIFTSFPGSGNTWMRHILETGTGVYTGSCVVDHYLLKVFPGEVLSDSTTIAVKDHSPCSECGYLFPMRRAAYLAAVCQFCARIQISSPAFDARVQPPMTLDQGRALMIIRNPFDAVLSVFQYSRKNNHTGYASDSDLAGRRFELFFKQHLEQWVFHSERYVRYVRHLIIYETLVKDTRNELVRLFAFLKTYRMHDLDVDGAVQRVMADLPGKFKRLPKAGRLDPYAIPRDGNVTLRQLGCRILRNTWRPEVWGPCE